MSSITGLFNALSILALGIMVLRRFYPTVDPYFQKASFILAEVDDILDRILLEYSNSDTLTKVNDVVEYLVEELEKAGYEVDKEDETKIENHVKGRLNQEEGANVSWEDGELKLNYKKGF